MSYGRGRRKTAVAKVWVTKDAGTQTVNNIPLKTYFPTPAMQRAALGALTLTNQLEQYGLKVVATGGGKQAQAEAVKLGSARALLTIDAGWRKQLKVAGMLKRDPRMKERKKAGLKRARRAPQFSKR